MPAAPLTNGDLVSRVRRRRHIQQCAERPRVNHRTASSRGWLSDRLRYRRMSTSNGVSLTGTAGANASLGYFGFDFPGSNRRDSSGYRGNIGGGITVGKPGMINLVPVTKRGVPPVGDDLELPRQDRRVYWGVLHPVVPS